MSAFHCTIENHGLCPWLQKGDTYEESRRSGSLPCVRGGGKILDFDGGVEKSAQSNPTISRMLNSSLSTRKSKKLHSAAKKIGGGADAIAIKFGSLKAPPVKAPYRGSACRPFYGWS